MRVVVVAHTLTFAWLVTRCQFTNGCGLARCGRLHVHSVVYGVGVRIVVMAVVTEGRALLGWVTMSVRMVVVVVVNVRGRIVVCGCRIMVLIRRDTTLWLVGQSDGHRD